jgi:hypothetical protein
MATGFGLFLFIVANMTSRENLSALKLVGSLCFFYNECSTIKGYWSFFKSFYRWVLGVSSFHVYLLNYMKNALEVFVEIPNPRELYFIFTCLKAWINFCSFKFELFIRTHLPGKAQLFSGLHFYPSKINCALVLDVSLDTS